MFEIAIVDDEEILADSLSIHLTELGYAAKAFYTGESFLQYLQSREPDIVFLDLRLPDLDGHTILERMMKSGHDSIPVVIITAHGTMESAIQAMKSGASDYINKPFELQEIDLLIEKTLRDRNLRHEVEHRRERDYKSDRLEAFVGSSRPMTLLLERVGRLSGIDNTTILIRGETGTGKGMLAKAIHNRSMRASKQFIEINCAALPETLLESELFGYEKGAFTDARQRKIGLVELADGGTLFLDEVGELPLTIQAKLLRFLENRAFRRIGGGMEIKVDVFIVAASNRDLEEAVREGSFRRDLYYRLNVIPLSVPPLREREEDVIALADHYLEYFSRKFNRPRKFLDEDARRAFLSYEWPGNIRELRNIVEMLVILSDRDTIDYGQIPEEIRRSLDAAEEENCDPEHVTGMQTLPELLRRYERQIILEALEKSRGVKTEAARLLGVSRYALIRRLKLLQEGGSETDLE
ncbi:MAG: sigma-54 dependent transcriptional regulator [Syntrophobacteraceae bacterium]|nr:sigma-54 dependent transcriptional regulator [Desulfobacteraceae bacterium]